MTEPIRKYLVLAGPDGAIHHQQPSRGGNPEVFWIGRRRYKFRGTMIAGCKVSYYYVC